MLLSGSAPPALIPVGPAKKKCSASKCSDILTRCVVAFLPHFSCRTTKRAIASLSFVDFHFPSSNHTVLTHTVPSATRIPPPLRFAFVRRFPFPSSTYCFKNSHCTLAPTAGFDLSLIQCLCRCFHSTKSLLSRTSAWTSPWWPSDGPLPSRSSTSLFLRHFCKNSWYVWLPPPASIFRSSDLYTDTSGRRSARCRAPLDLREPSGSMAPLWACGPPLSLSFIDFSFSSLTSFQKKFCTWGPAARLDFFC